MLLCGIATKTSRPSEEETGDDDKEATADQSVVKLTKAERRAKLKKSKKEAKKQGTELAKTEVEQTPQAAVLVCSFWRFLSSFVSFTVDILFIGCVWLRWKEGRNDI